MQCKRRLRFCALFLSLLGLATVGPASCLAADASSDYAPTESATPWPCNSQHQGRPVNFPEAGVPVTARGNSRAAAEQAAVEAAVLKAALEGIECAFCGPPFPPNMKCEPGVAVEGESRRLRMSTGSAELEGACTERRRGATWECSGTVKNSEPGAFMIAWVGCGLCNADIS